MTVDRLSSHTVSKELNPKGEVLLMSATLGSTAYGLDTEDSDIDTVGAFVASPWEILGAMGHHTSKKSISVVNPDITLHEVGKLFHLCSKGNPTVLELLWADPKGQRQQLVDLIVGNRIMFLSDRSIRGAFGGYALQQAERLKRRTEKDPEAGFESTLKKRTAKHARHCFRLMLSGGNALENGELILDMSDKRDYIFEVGELAENDVDAFMDLFQKEFEKFNNITSILPDKPDYDKIDAVLRKIREASFHWFN